MILNESAQELIDAANPAVPATINPDGSPQTSMVRVGRDGADLLISTTAGRRKDSNVQRDPRVSLLVVDRNDSERYVEVRGSATVSEDSGREFAQRLAGHYEGEGAGRSYKELPPEVVRVVIRIAAEKVNLRN